VCGEGDEEEGWFRKATGWKIGDGGIVRLWEDVWLQNSSIKSLYPRLYSLSLDQGKTVGEVGRWEEGRWRFWPNWRRERYDWESNMAVLTHQPANGTLDNVYDILWQAKAMPKALITAWRVLLDRLPTTVNLIRRGAFVNSPFCAMCNLSQESSQHLFIDCVFAQRVWSACYSWVGILGVQNQEIRNHLINFYLVHLSIKQNQV